ncbi:TRAP transporter fused permease subunit [Pseudomonas wenzhouensis]|nr:TRAP transporter fused permease subunit [Pseudomonas wenzhouensis]MDM9653246.1 TRAP transporter fused permease subunit [Pseudomonas wenzhouensis]
MALSTYTTIFSRGMQIVGEGNKVELRGKIKALIELVSVALCLYMVWFALAGRIEIHFQGAIFLGVMLPVTFLSTTLNRRINRRTWIDYALAVVSVAVCSYYLYNIDYYTDFFEGITPISAVEQAAGVALTALAFEACRRAIGLGLTGVITVLLLYVAFGSYLPGAFQHGGVSLEYFTTMQTVTTNGIFGQPLQVAAGYAFLFVLFGTFFHFSGGGQLLFDVAAALMRGTSGGASKACVVSSGLYGSISGSPVADVATTGPVNIPLMIRAGATPTRAAATEAAASSGGAFLPPVMGAVAFLMVEFTGIPYQELLLSAALVGALYYFGVFLAVHLEAKREGEVALSSDVRITLWDALIRNWSSLVPLVILIYFLLAGYSPLYVAAAATASTIVTSWFGASPIGPKRFVEACAATVLQMSSLTAAVAVAGLVMGAISLTGLEGKFTLLLMGLSGGFLIPTLFLSAVVLVLLGMGMPTPGVYVMGVALLSPVLIGTFGLPVLETHLFLLYFSCASAITPPVAVACFASGAIAGAPPMAVATHAVRLGIAVFILPFFLISHPGVVLDASFAMILLDVALGVVLVAAATVVAVGFGHERSLWVRRILLAVVAAGIFAPNPWWSASAALLTVVFLAVAFLSLSKRNVSEKTVRV